MKIAVFSDIHSNFKVFNKAYMEAKKENIDLYIFLGDYVTDGFEGNEVINLIKSTNNYAINGNREVEILNYDKFKYEKWNKYTQFRSLRYGYEILKADNINYLKSLPIYKLLKINNKTICISHGSPHNVRERIINNDVNMYEKLINDFESDVYLFGHTHKSYITEYKNKLFINPGSIGLPTDGKYYKYGILTIDDKISYEQKIVEYEYNELENHYKKSNYYEQAPIWCSLILDIMKTGKDKAQEFMLKVFEEAKKENIDISEFIPDDLFKKVFNDYIKENI